MRQNNNHLRRNALTLLLPVVLLGCTDEMRDLFPDDDASRGQRLEFQASINQDNTSRADESGFADGDRFGVFVVNRTDGKPGTLSLSGNNANNIALTYDAEGNRWNQATPIYWTDATTHADFYGYYPFDNSLADVESYSFEVKADQSVCGDDKTMGSYEASDFLWAEARDVAPGTRVDLVFHHRLAGVKVVLKQGTGFSGGEWESLSRTVTVDNTVRTAHISLSTGTATPYGAFDRHVVASPEGDTYRAVVIPQTVDAGKTTIGITIDGITYSYSREGGMTYTAGKLHTFTLTVDKHESSGKYALSLNGEEISAWEADSSSHSFEANSYLVVDVQEAGTLKELLQAMNCDLSSLKNLKITGKIDDRDFQVMRDEMHQLTSLNLSLAKVYGNYRREIEGQNWWDWPTETMEDMIPDQALTHKESIRRIVLPDGIKRIGDNAFSNLRLTSTLIIPESVTRIDNWAFSCIGEEATIIMPSSLEYIGGCAFYGLEARMELKLTNTIKYIGGSAFSGARGATGTFSIPSHLEDLGESAFRDCGRNLTGDIVIPVGFKEIPDNVFMGMDMAKGTNLTLPEGLQKIGDSAFKGMKFLSTVTIPESVTTIYGSAFKHCTFTDRSVKLPANLQYLGRCAFAYSNISGDLEFPASLDAVLGGGDIDNCGAFSGITAERLIIGDNVLQIESRGFNDIYSLKYLSIGKNVSFIGNEAFAYCQSLLTVVCMASEPPRIDENAFQDVPFDRIILEVPENSVEKYRNATVWRNFYNITPHKELSFNISDITCLDKGVVREGRLTAEGPWTVTECPSWVHVSPSSGQLKDELTVTVDPLPSGEGDREGRIVFNLTGKGYSTYTTVRQKRFDECEQDKEIVLQEASAGAKAIPVFIVGEGFDADNITDGEYMRRMRETMDQLFAIEPYKSYRDRFTVTTAVACSPERGVGDVYTIKANCFGTDGLQPDEWKLREYVEKVSKHAGRDMANALIIVVANRECFDGWSTIGNDGCSIACIGVTNDGYPYDQRGLVQHYAGGEAFAGLGTEAVSHFDHIKGCTCPYCNQLSEFNQLKKRGYLENLTMSSKMSDAPWNEFIFHPKYSAMVDMWEGGYNHLRGVWRSEANSVMNTYIAYFNTISRYAIYKQIKRRCGETATLDDFIANDIIEIP